MTAEMLEEARKHALSALENSEAFVERCLADLSEMPVHRGKVRARWQLEGALETVQALIAELQPSHLDDSQRPQDVVTDWINKGVAAEEALDGFVDEIEARDRSESDQLAHEALATAKDDINSMHTGLAEDLEGFAHEPD